jgi:hypothetical protein
MRINEKLMQLFDKRSFTKSLDQNGTFQDKRLSDISPKESTIKQAANFTVSDGSPGY